MVMVRLDLLGNGLKNLVVVLGEESYIAHIECARLLLDCVGIVLCLARLGLVVRSR